MKKCIVIFVSAFFFIKLNAQQWSGSATTTGLINRDGNVLIGSTPMGGSYGANDRVLQVRGVGSFVTFRSTTAPGSFDIAFTSGGTNFNSVSQPISLGTDYVSRLKILTNGNVGIGTVTPQFRLDVVGTGRIGAASSTNSNLIIQGGAGVYDAWWLSGGNGILKIGGNGGTEPSAGAININNVGNVAIGTTNAAGYKLAVNGSAIFTEARVKPNANWPDYVFHKNYKLLPLNELEKFVRQNHHLSNIPTAEQVKENGIELGNMSSKLLEKIEELTLYVIELKKENELLNKRLDALQVSKEK